MVSTRFRCSVSFLGPGLLSSNVLTRDRTCFSMSSILFCSRSLRLFACTLLFPRLYCCIGQSDTHIEIKKDQKHFLSLNFLKHCQLDYSLIIIGGVLVRYSESSLLHDASLQLLGKKYARTHMWPQKSQNSTSLQSFILRLTLEVNLINF